MFDQNRFQATLCELESTIEDLQRGNRTQHTIETARHHLRVALDAALDQNMQERHSLEDTLRVAEKLRPPSPRIAAVLVRSFVEPTLFNGHERLAGNLIESSISDTLTELGYPRSRAQTYEKHEVLRHIYSLLVDRLSCFRECGTSLAEILSHRTELIRALSGKPIAWYLRQIGRDGIKGEVQTLFTHIGELTECMDSGLGPKMELAERCLVEFEKRLAANPPAILRSSYAPFLQGVRRALEGFRTDVNDRLAAKVIVQLEGNELTRKLYPLHQVGRAITVRIPIVNLGPGIARDVVARIETNPDSAVTSGELQIGDLPPGPIDISVELMMLVAARSLDLAVQLSWTTLALPVGASTNNSITIQAQSPYLDWGYLDLLDPYSTEVAEGDEFVGRQEKVNAVARRLLTSQMRSTYITGQKRVGKTSLAKAIAAYVKTSSRGANYEIIYIEWGSYARKDPEATVEALGRRLAADLQGAIEPAKRLNGFDFRGTLAPLIDIAQLLHKEVRDKRFILMLDEFDEIHSEMYRLGPLAEVLFSNLRTLASQRNLAIVLIGGEKMPFVMASQGDQLNKFVREPLDYFSAEHEWSEYAQLVEKPTSGTVSWRLDAIRMVHELTAGHPYYTKLLCGKTFQRAVAERDGDITVDEVKRAAAVLAVELDVNAFAHYWRDGIRGDKEEEEARASLRAKFLAIVGRLLRLGREVTADNISAQRELLKLDAAQIFPLAREFCSRAILTQDGDAYRFVVPLFGDWLREVGADRIVVDTLPEEIANELERAVSVAKISAAEITDLVQKWAPYRGQEVSAEHVRAWLEQVDDPRDQRILFKLLQHLRFVSEIEIRNMLKVAFSMFTPHLPEFVRQSRAMRRSDLLVCYVDGQGKSGQLYASRFAEENSVSAKCVMSAEQFPTELANWEAKGGSRVAAVVIVDDIVGTGRTLSARVTDFISANYSALQSRGVFVGVVALIGTVSGEQTVRQKIARIKGIEVDLRLCEPLSMEHVAFGEGAGIWESIDEKNRAKALCIDLGAQIYQDNPLGFGNQGLLVTFPNSCPNNSLPILHSVGKGDRWKPLFLRPVN